MLPYSISAHLAFGQVQSTTIHFMESTASSFSKLCWRPPELDKKKSIIGYIIEYKDINSQKWEKLDKYLVSGPVCLVDGLIPRGYYLFRVTSKYDDGQVSPSEPSASKSGFIRI